MPGGDAGDFYLAMSSRPTAYLSALFIRGSCTVRFATSLVLGPGAKSDRSDSLSREGHTVTQLPLLEYPAATPKVSHCSLDRAA